MKWDEAIGDAARAALASLSASLLSASLCSSPANAADMTPIVQRPATSGYIPAQFFWTGFYMGAGVGYGWGTAPFVDPLTGASATPSINGFLVSGVAGLNYQFGSVVVGAEGDFTGAWAKGSVIDATGNSLEASVFWTSSITGRLGWAIDRLLIYGKGGAALDYDRNTVTKPNSTSALGTVNHAGWTVGGGVEYAVTEHWTARIEYDYLHFASKSAVFQGAAIPVPPGLGALLGLGGLGGTVGLSFNEIKGIMAYKF